MSTCVVAGHGALVYRTDAMGDFYCPACQAAFLRAYVTNSTPGRVLVSAEARRRGGRCEFEMEFPETTIRCAARFEDGGLHWHHVDPSSKRTTISALSVRGPLASLRDELAKCQLLCRMHHRIVQRSTR